ncbi:uncharacterized protein LOC112057919 [Bicyclus anynana]|uniref:Uncharacterized protein LOC112057919 n=1 Tax=Bicyclus anynana TaxID=110368 RepID=A0A6J1P8Z7_BICAN|nr:uncharacterized protein LOC112057919 [Bicyclus anynana]
MNMFQSILDTIPKTRSQLVNDLDIPEDVTLQPYIWSEPDEDISDSIASVSIEDLEVKTPSSDSSLALSRAMTDSEIDYNRYRMLKNRSFSDPWVQMKVALDTFPPGYLDSLKSFQGTSSESSESSWERGRYHEELKLKMQRFFDEECRVFSPDDPGLIALEEALQDVELKSTDSDSNGL